MSLKMISIGPAPVAMALVAALCLLTACAPSNPTGKAGEIANPAKVAPSQVVPGQVASTKSASLSQIADSAEKSKYRIEGDFAGGGNVQDFGGDMTVKDLINNLLNQHDTDLDLHNNFAYTDHITREALTVLQKRDASFVKTICLAAAQLTDIEIEPISKLHLIDADLSSNKVKDLHAIKNMTALRELDISHCPVSSQGIAVISGLGNLQKLHLGGTPVHDSDLVNLYSLKQLDLIDLSGCVNLSPAAVEAFRAHFPHCYTTFVTAQSSEISNGMNALNRIIRTLGRLNEYEQADDAVEKLISKWLSQSPPPYALIAQGYRIRGTCQAKLNNLRKAGRMYSASLDVYSRHLPDDPAIPVVQSEWAALLSEMESNKEAIQLRQAADRYWRSHHRDSSAEKCYQANLSALKELGKSH